MHSINVDEDKTVFMPITKPQPERVASSESTSVANTARAMGHVQQAVANTSQWKLNNIDYLSGPNQLMENATEIFSLHYQLIQHAVSGQAEQLRSVLNDALVKFELRCQQQGMTKPVTKSAKYVICAFMDETILNAEWAHDVAWSHHSLLSDFFNETWGGETFFKIRQFCIENLHEYIQLLELIYICMCLGFRGKFAIMSDGDIQLDRVKRETYQIIREFRGESFNQPLSPHWQSTYSGKKTLKQYQSVWIALGLSLAVLLVSYTGLSLFLSSSSAPVAAKVSSLMQQRTE